MKAQRKAIAGALAEHREAWHLQSEDPQDWLDQVEGDLIHRLAKATHPTELVEALKTYADMCPDCDGTGIRRAWDGDPEQCQWCFEARGALALYEPEEAENA